MLAPSSLINFKFLILRADLLIFFIESVSEIINEDGTNIYDLLKYKNVILTSTSIKKIESKILNEKN